MIEFRDLSDNAADPTKTTWTYDLNGNVRSTETRYRAVDAAPTAATQTTGVTWNRYDSVDRMVHVEGTLANGQIIGGKRLEYDAAGNRVRLLTDLAVEGGGQTHAGVAVEHYDWTADGYLARVGQSRDEWNPSTSALERSSTIWMSEDVRDAMGRLTSRTESSGVRTGVTTTHSRTAAYDKSSLITSETNFTYVGDNPTAGVTAHFRSETTTYNYFEGSTWRGVITSVTTSGFRDPWPLGTETNANTPLPSTRTDYAYSWWDDARQLTVTLDGDTGSTRNGLQTSTFNYDVNGRVASVFIADARSRTVTFVTDAYGQVLTRDEADRNLSQQDPATRYWYFDGQRIGQVTNNDGYTTEYVAEMRSRSTTPNNAQGPFIGNMTSPRYGVDFDLAYEALTPNAVRSTGQTWTIRDGDTLQGIASTVWGDASLWYLIAEINGLTSASLLTAGQSLTIPAKLANVHNSADTFRPYDPNEALGNLNPTQPKPPKRGGGCGVAGQIIMVAIAVAVSAVVLGPAAAAAAKVLTGAGVASGAAATGGAIAGGALAGAAGSIASQAFGVATGIQEEFDWKGVGISAISGGVSAGLGNLGGSSVLAEVGRSIAANTITQGVAVATGLQDRFNWTGVATSAVMSGFGAAYGQSISTVFGGGLVGETAAAVARAAAGAGAMTLLDGTSFGDNLRAVLPDAIGQTIGNRVAGGIAAASEARQRREIAINSMQEDFLALHPGATEEHLLLQRRQAEELYDASLELARPQGRFESDERYQTRVRQADRSVSRVRDDRIRLAMEADGFVPTGGQFNDIMAASRPDYDPGRWSAGTLLLERTGQTFVDPVTGEESFEVAPIEVVGWRPEELPRPSAGPAAILARPIDSAINILGDKAQRIGRVIDERPWLRYGLEGAGFVADGVSLAYGGSVRFVVSQALGAGQGQAINSLATASGQRFAQVGYDEDFAVTASAGVATGLTLALSSRDAVGLVRNLPELMQGLRQSVRAAAASAYLRSADVGQTNFERQSGVPARERRYDAYQISDRRGTWQIPTDVVDKLPAGWGRGVLNRDGQGFRWQDPSNQGNGVRIDRGNPRNSQSIQREDHVVVRAGGRIVSRDGSLLPPNARISDYPFEAHIPLKDYVNWARWNSPN